MSEKAQEAVIKPEYIIENLLEQNTALMKEKAYSAAINKQLQEESRNFLDLAAQLEEQNQQLIADKNELLAKLEKLENQIPKKAAATRNKKDVIEAEIVEGN